jgi:hypothetical protein
VPRVELTHLQAMTPDAAGLDPRQADLLHARGIELSMRLPLITIERPSRAVFDRQLDKVIAHCDAELRRSRSTEAMAQVLPQVPFWNSLLPFSPWRTPAACEFIECALAFANQVVHRIKHALSVPRPSELSPLVQPLLQTPGWAAFPSGHATEAFLFARLAIGLLGPAHVDAGTQVPVEGVLWEALRRQAASIADNRVYVGLHFPVDGVAGRLLGQALAEYVMAKAVGAAWAPRRFLASDAALADVDLDWSLPTDGGAAQPPYYAREGLGAPVPANPILQALWTKARGELATLGFR